MERVEMIASFESLLSRMKLDFFEPPVLESLDRGQRIK